MMTDSVDQAFKLTLVKKQTCFAKLTPQEIEELATLFIERRVAEGAVIVNEGDPVDSVYLIVSGIADVQHITIQDGARQTTSVATLGPNEAIGLNETGFYSLSGLRTATVVAKTEMVLLCLSVAAFHGFALANSHVNAIMRQNADSLRSN